MYKLVLISGGTASGKTTIVNKLRNDLGDDNITILSMDNYYKSNDDISLEQKKDINFDHPKSIDFSLLRKHIKNLLLGKKINSPIYDFRIHSRLSDTKTLEPKKIIILEGIFALYDDTIRNLSNLNCYIEADSDIRFIRRLKRDVIERARTIDNVVNQYIKTVKPMHELYIDKTKEYADIIINSTYDSSKDYQLLLKKMEKLLK